MLKSTNVKERLDKLKLKVDEQKVLQQVYQLLHREAAHDEEIEQRVLTSKGEIENNFDFDLMESSRIYHISQIEKLCVDYRLRFLDAGLYKSDLPIDAIEEIKNLEKQHNITLQGFQMVAPSKLFKLENADDPLLFSPIGNGYYYFIYKWGNDLHPLRKLQMWPFKNFETFIATVFLLSLALTYIVPKGFFMDRNSTTEFLLLFMFMFKWVGGICLYYGFAKGKNFNTAIWRSKYFNA
jgi:hypothetical protein